MVFSSPVFLFVFLPLVLCLYYNPWWRGRGLRNAILLISSLGFYAWGEPLFVFVMLAWIAMNWLIALRMAASPQGRQRKRWLVLALVLDVGLLLAFKYLDFAVRTAGFLLNRKVPVLQLALPIGISFFTFQIMSYVVDVYRQQAPVQRSFARVAMYVSLFPQLVAGPIVRYQTIATELSERRENRQDFADGVRRFVFGLGKKVLLADYVGLIADNIFTAHGNLSVLSAWLGIVCYALQIYFDFSGYSDMAIGLGRMFGFHFLENFRYPYIARSVTDFWRRWHMSMGTWFRDYVYIPLGGNRVSTKRWVFNVFTVWLLTGLWHGASWNFVLWGLYYGVLLLVERLTGLHKRLGPLAHGYTLLLVLFGWVLFRAETLPQAWTYLGYLFGQGASGLMDGVFTYHLRNGWPVLLAALVCCVPLWRWLEGRVARTSPDGGLAAGMQLARLVAMVVVFGLAVLVSVKATFNPFIYFNF